MKTKKLLAIGLATIMTMASSLTAFAADPVNAPSSGTGTYEGYLEKTIVAGTYTTEASASIDFAIDPQGLSATKYNGSKTVESGATVLFARADSGAASNYMGRSDTITITSKSSVDTNIKCVAKLDTLDGYTLVSKDTDLTSDEKGEPQLYIALTDGTKTIPITSAEGAEYLEKITAKADNFEVKYESDAYSYVAKADADFSTMKKEVWIVAKAAGKWTGVTVPKLTLAYSTDAYVDNAAPTFAKGADNEINITAGAGNDGLKEIKSIKVSLNGTEYDAMTAMAGAYDAGTLTASSFTFADNYVAFWGAGDQTATITYETNGGETKTADVTVTFK